MKEEIWRTIEDYPTYKVSNLGQVRNIKTGRVLRPSRDAGGYLRVILCLNGKPKSHLIHRLVATAFIPNPENKRTVNHISGDKTNNCVDNLEWNTYSENIKHAFKMSLKINPKQKIRCIETGQTFESYLQASKYFGCGPGSIWGSVTKGWRCKGYHFKLV